MKSPPLRLAKISAVLIVVFLLANAGVTAWAIYSRFEQTNQGRVVQHSLNQRFAAVTLADCLEIEKLKTNVRQQAIEDYANLDSTLALLNLKKTPAIVKRATSDRDHKLKVYAAEACPRPVGGKQ